MWYLVFLLDLLRAEVQPTSGPQHCDHVTVQCAQGEEGIGRRVWMCA